MALALVLGIGVKGAQADSLLFPYLNSQAGVFSFVTIVNDGLFQNSTITGYYLQYGHKPNPVVQRRGCSLFSTTADTTPADMMTWEVNAKVLDAGNLVLFENAAPTTSSIPPAFVLPAGQTAWLIVEPQGTGADQADVARVWGWAEVIDTAANLNLAYSTHNFVNDSDVLADYANISGTWTAWSWYPATYVNTSWHVLMLGTRAAMSASIRGAIEAWDGAIFGAYDRDELHFDASKRKTVRCFAIVTRGDVLQPGAAAATNNGGWMYIGPASGSVTAPPLDPDDPGGVYNPAGNHLVHKIQQATPAAGVGTRMTVNREPSWNGFPFAP
jgi:hypothetical protein